MARFFLKREETKGLSPGSLVFIGNKKVDNIRIRVIDYDGAQLKEDELKDIAEGAEFKRTNTVTWINVDGLHDLALMKEIGSIFDLHPLLLEDILNTGQRPKLEEFENCLFLVLKCYVMTWKTNDYFRTIKYGAGRYISADLSGATGRRI